MPLTMRLLSSLRLKSTRFQKSTMPWKYSDEGEDDPAVLHRPASLRVCSRRNTNASTTMMNVSTVAIAEP
jgi:hypothetical protein